jgi:hypothetical protein
LCKTTAMRYLLKNKDELDAAFLYLTKLAGKEVVAEVKEVRPKRSGQQNRYLHLLIGFYGLETGYRLDEAKTIYKRIANPDTFVYEKDGIYFLRSSADLDSAEMTKSIDRFKEFALEHNGVRLPDANNEDELRSIQNKMEESNYL